MLSFANAFAGLDGSWELRKTIPQLDQSLVGSVILYRWDQGWYAGEVRRHFSAARPHPKGFNFRVFYFEDEDAADHTLAAGSYVGSRTLVEVEEAVPAGVVGGG